MNEATIGIVLALNGLIIVVIEMVLVYKLEGRRSISHYISLGSLLIGISYVFFNIAGNSLLTALAGMLLITFGEMLLFPFINTFWTSRSTQYNRGEYAALYTMAFSAAHVLAPTLGSQIVKNFGFTILWYVVFGICVIASVGFYKLR